jgi:hypothetical protein
MAKKTRTLHLLLFILLFAVAGSSQEETELFLSYQIENSDIRFIDEIKHGIHSFEQSDDFLFKTQLAPKTMRKEWILDKRLIIDSGERLVRKQQDASQSWFFIPEESIDIWDINHLHLHWSLAHTHTLPNLDISVDIATDENEIVNLHTQYPKRNRQWNTDFLS